MSGLMRARGQPLAALVLVLGSWTVARAVTWQAGAEPDSDTDALLRAQAVRVPGRPAMHASTAIVPVQAGVAAGIVPSTLGPADGQLVLVSATDLARLIAAATRRVAWMQAPAVAEPATAARTHGGWFAYALPQPASGMSGRSASPVRAPGGNVAPGNPLPLQRTAVPRRWTADAWALLRQGGSGPLAGGALPATYGASQAGAILRYHFAPGSVHDAAAYVRFSAALDPAGSSGAAGEKEAALGAQARPLGGVPVVIAGELRATSGSGRTRLRPAAYAVTQLPPVALPLQLTGEAYLQGGYVAGRGATPFADGQLRVDRALGTVRGRQLRVGGGIWGGIQNGASRLDVGPGATLGLPLNRRISARVAVDYRLRVAGNAEPPSGPALTVSAGF